MLNPPTQPVPQDAATVAFDLLSDVLDYLDHNDPRCHRVSLAMQLLNGDLSITQALDYADALPRSS
jgi:hypothetical protein